MLQSHPNLTNHLIFKNSGSLNYLATFKMILIISLTLLIWIKKTEYYFLQTNCNSWLYQSQGVRFCNSKGFTHTVLCVCENQHCAALSFAIVFVTFMCQNKKRETNLKGTSCFQEAGWMAYTTCVTRSSLKETIHSSEQTGSKKELTGSQYVQPAIEESQAPQQMRNWSKTLGRKGRTAGQDEALYLST